MDRISKILLIIVLGCSVNSIAQAPDAPENLLLLESPSGGLTIDPAVLDTLSDPAHLIPANQQIDYSTSFILPDTVGITSIVVKLGTTQGGSEFVNQTFLFDSTPSGSFSYERDESSLLLGLGTHNQADPIYCEVYVIDTQGNQSAVTTFSTN